MSHPVGAVIEAHGLCNAVFALCARIQRPMIERA